jgi:hypothetical protein
MSVLIAYGTLRERKFTREFEEHGCHNANSSSQSLFVFSDETGWESG